MSDLEARLMAVEERNARVEIDKAWEISLTRWTAISIATYLIVGGLLQVIGAANPWLGALVPVCGFILSTLSLRVIKNIWGGHRSAKGKGLSHVTIH